MKGNTWLLIFLILGTTELPAQVGASNLAISQVGRSNFGHTNIGHAITPKCRTINACNFSACSVYIFIGNGDWQNPSNWSNGMVPPATLTHCNQIVINPSNTSKAVLDDKITLEEGSNLTVMPGKKLWVNGNLVIGK